MTANQNVKREIRKKIEKIPADRLIDVLEFIQRIEQQEFHVQRILSFAGIWRDFDQDILDDFTIHLHQNRMINDRQINI